MADNDNENRCPLCGKPVHEGETFCRDCQEIAQNAYPDELLTHQELEEILEEEGGEELLEEEQETVVEDNPVAAADIESSKTKNGKGLYIFFGVCLGLLIAVGIYSSLSFVEKKNREGTESNYWNQCIEENTPLAYSKYLVQYPPDGKYSDEAQSRIRELREGERKEWETLRNTNNVDALFTFLRDHPETPYAREITLVIDSLSWITTSNENTAASYLAYLENVKLGRYSGEYEIKAKERYDYLSQLKPVEGEDLKEVKAVLDNFFKSLSSLNDKSFAKTIPDTIDKFYSSNGKTPKAVIDSLKTDLKNRKIKSVAYTYTSDSLDVIQDNKGIYFISVPVVEEFTYRDRKKKKDAIKYKVKIELTDKKLIRSISKIQ